MSEYQRPFHGIVKVKLKEAAKLDKDNKQDVNQPDKSKAGMIHVGYRFTNEKDENAKQDGFRYDYDDSSDLK